MELKFKLTDETKVNWLGKTLFRIEATVDIPARGVKKGDKGGWVESEKTCDGNARVLGNAWVFDNAEVFGDARVSGNARVFDNAEVFGDARVSGNAWVYGNARVYGNAEVFGDAWVFGDAQVYGDAQVSLEKTYTKGFFLHSSDSVIEPTVIDQSKEDGFDDSRDYKSLLVVGDYEIGEVESEQKAADRPTIDIGGTTYEVTAELTQALNNLRKVE